MKQFFSSLPRNIICCFKGRMILWHLLAIILTLILVTSGFDWFFFRSTRARILQTWMFPAVVIGGLIPILLPVAMLAAGGIAGSFRTRRIAWAIGQAELIGSIISSSYKAVTGRAHPTHEVDADLSLVFRFGFLRGGVFWGWPSSHTTIAFAMAFTVFTLFPKQRWLGVGAIAYALYIGLGVSMSIHWFSDFIAGALVGAVIGTVVGGSFSFDGEPTLRGSLASRRKCQEDLA